MSWEPFSRNFCYLHAIVLSLITPNLEDNIGVFLDEKYSDIVFEVGGDQRKDNAMKVAKIARERFPAHRVIVANSS
ncbi:MAG: hypothetical protein ACK55Z_16790, partial [bacterium]